MSSFFTHQPCTDAPWIVNAPIGIHQTREEASNIMNDTVLKTGYLFFG